MHATSYHLKLELYPPPTTKSHDHSSAAFVAPATTDIFSSALPAHRTAPWSGEHLVRATHLSRTPRESVRTPELRPLSAGNEVEQAGDALLLPERNAALKELVLHIPSSPKPSSSHAQRDWRFGPVTIDSVDMVVRHKTTTEADKHGAKLQGTNHTRAEYVPSDVRSTDVGWGVVHLYKDVGDDRGRVHGRSGRPPKEDGVDVDFDLDKCCTLCILAVPSWMMPSDLLGFVGDQTREDVSHFRLIRTGRANKYMVLMKFRSSKKARDWQRAWNGRLFSAMEPENCHVVFIRSVRFLASDGQQAAKFPENTEDTFTSSRLTSGTKPYAPPTPALIELPTCPVCLERMDETTGLLTILCQHVFHCACLEKWRGSGCPVCRYTQSPSSTFPYPRPDSIDLDANPECAVCASTTNLWVCLICGSIGCGRYDSAHAYAHYESTSHCYAMDIMSQHVWDYAGDGYVHRLIQNKDTALSGAAPSASTPHSRTRAAHHQQQHPNNAFRTEAEDLVPREKMETMANEYTFLLTSQLEGQRRYFEEQVQRAVDKAGAAAARAEDALARLEGATARLAVLEDGARAATAALADAERVGATAARRAERFETMARGAVAGLREERVVSEGLLDRIRAMEGKLATGEAESTRLRIELDEAGELNRDLTMFVEGREKLRLMEEEHGMESGEVQGGMVVVGQAKRAGRQGRKKR